MTGAMGLACLPKAQAGSSGKSEQTPTMSQKRSSETWLRPSLSRQDILIRGIQRHLIDEMVLNSAFKSSGATGSRIVRMCVSLGMSSIRYRRFKLPSLARRLSNASSELSFNANIAKPLISASPNEMLMLLARWSAIASNPARTVSINPLAVKACSPRWPPVDRAPPPMTRSALPLPGMTTGAGAASGVGSQGPLALGVFPFRPDCVWRRATAGDEARCPFWGFLDAGDVEDDGAPPLLLIALPGGSRR